MFAKPPEVLVVGAGPVGLYTALSLTKRGVRVKIIDNGFRPCSHSYALGLHPRTLKLLQSVGLAASVLAHAYPIWRMGFYDAAGPRAQINLDFQNDSSFLTVLRQSSLEEYLEKALQDHGVEVLWRHQLAGLIPFEDHVTAQVDKLEKQSKGYLVAEDKWVVAKSMEFHAPFVIGADGHDSQVRKALNIDFPTVAKPLYYAMFEFETSANLDHEARIVFGDRTTDVLWPLPDGHCRWSFQLPDYDRDGTEAHGPRVLASGFGRFAGKRVEDYDPIRDTGYDPVLDAEHLGALLAERAPWFHGSIDNFTWRTVARFEQRLAKHFGHGRVWLTGDAAHLAGPAGVQSMNLGFLEAEDLAARCERILNEAAPLEYLFGYDQHWTRTWRQLHGLTGPDGLTGTDGLTRTHELTGTDPYLVSPPEADAWIAAHSSRILSCLPGGVTGLGVISSQLTPQHETSCTLDK